MLLFFLLNGCMPIWIVFSLVDYAIECTAYFRQNLVLFYLLFATNPYHCFFIYLSATHTIADAIMFVHRIGKHIELKPSNLRALGWKS